MRDKRRQPRWWQHIKAVLGRYFWAPCPICRKKFGGHESVDGDSLFITPYEGRAVCANCVELAKIRNNDVVSWPAIEVVYVDVDPMEG